MVQGHDSPAGSDSDSGALLTVPEQAAAKAAARVAEEAEVAKGQRTAIITGAVSIVFGVCLSPYCRTYLAPQPCYRTNCRDKDAVSRARLVVVAN